MRYKVAKIDKENSMNNEPSILSPPKCSRNSTIPNTTPIRNTITWIISVFLMLESQ